MYRVVQNHLPYSILAQVETRTEALERLASLYSESTEAYKAFNLYQEASFSHDRYARVWKEDDQDGYRLALHTGEDGRERQYSHSERYPDVLSALSALPGLLTAEQSLYLTVEPTEPRIVTTYETVTPESAENGDFEDCGFEDEDGYRCVPDDQDETAVSLAVSFLRDKGVTEPSSSPWSRGTWYSTESQVEDWQTAEEKSYSYHLKGFTEDQERAIYSALFPTRRTN